MSSGKDTVDNQRDQMPLDFNAADEDATGEDATGSMAGESSAPDNTPSVLPETPPADHAARATALDVSGSYIVQAPAGSGKTDLLIRRVLCLLTTVETPEQIIAITFTRKAAAEMRQRIHALLLAAERDDPVQTQYELTAREMANRVLERERQMQWGLIENPERLSLQTIDSLCGMLTRELPATSTLGAPMAAEDHAERLYQRAALQQIQSSIQVEGPVGDATRSLLLEFDNNLGRLQRMLADMLANRDQWKRVLRHVSHRDGLEESLRLVVEMRLQKVLDLMPDCIDAGLVDLAAYAVYAMRGLFSPGDRNYNNLLALEPLEALPGATIEDLPVWEALAQMLLSQQDQLRKPRGITKAVGFPKAPADLKELGIEAEDAVAHKDAMVAILEELAEYPQFCEALVLVRGLPGDGYTDEQWEILENLIILLVGCIESLNREFSESASSDFTEIALRANLALGTDDEPTDLALYLDYRIQHLLVDEFQDTSLSQFELFEKLVAGWEPGDGRTFFAVGDPMQSIYRFRDAEVALFGDARANGIGGVVLEPLQLTVNFRSEPDVVSWCNHCFSTIFPDTDDRISGAVQFSESEAFDAPVNPESPAGEAAVESVQWHMTVQQQPVVQAGIDPQASEIATVASQLVGQSGEGESIALLVRSRTRLLDMFTALRREGVAVQAVEMEALSSRPVVGDIRSLAFALLYPHDKVAWLSLLRAPWCGLTLDELYQVNDDDVNLTLWERINDAAVTDPLEAETRARLQRFITVMSPAVQAVRRESLVQWVEACWIQLGGPAVCRDGDSDLDAAEVAFTELLLLQESGELQSRRRVEEQLAGLYAPSVTPEGVHVQVMTIHKSKGLEFDAVMLPYLERKPNADRGGLLNWFELTDDNGAHCLLAPLDTRLDKTTQNREPITRLIRTYHQQRERNEVLRVLYVAATRAKKSLHLFGSLKTDDEGYKKPIAGSLLDALWPVASEVENLVSTGQGAQVTEPVGETEAETNAETTGPADSGELSSMAIALSRVQQMPADWSMPAEVVSYAGPVTATNELSQEAPEYLWAGVDASAIGTVVHQELQLLCTPHQEHLREQDAARWQATLEIRLQALGVGNTRLASAVERVDKAINNCLQDDTGKWLLDTSHAESEVELPLSAWMDGEFHSVVIDRTFVADGKRWIVDYKTGDHRGGSLDEFLDREQERYQSQLERYARIMGARYPGEMMLGLYFPMLSSFRCWEPSHSVTGVP